MERLELIQWEELPLREDIDHDHKEDPFNERVISIKHLLCIWTTHSNSMNSLGLLFFFLNVVIELIQLPR